MKTEKEKVRILVLLTDGYDKKAKKPNLPGRDRLKKLTEILNLCETNRTMPFDQVAIIGGWPDERNITLAVHYKHYLAPCYQKMITILDDKTNNTVDDLNGLMEILKPLYPDAIIELHLITLKAQFRRIKKTVRKFGAIPVHIETNEGFDPEHSLRWWKQILLYLINIIDPRWRWLGTIARYDAEDRALAYRLR